METEVCVCVQDGPSGRPSRVSSPWFMRGLTLAASCPLTHQRCCWRQTQKQTGLEKTRLLSFSYKQDWTAGSSWMSRRRTEHLLDLLVVSFVLCVSAELLSVLTRPPQSPRHQPLASIQPGQQPVPPDPALPPSPHPSPYSPQRASPGGDGGGDGPEGGGPGGGGGALLQFLAGGPSPLPSPRCSSPSLRFNSDPDSAPSPPCSQQCRGRADRTEEPEDQCPPSIPFLTRHIQTLKKKVRRFEDQFEQETNYKPSHNDKYSNPEMVRVMSELAKARKQLKVSITSYSLMFWRRPPATGRRCSSQGFLFVSQGTKQEKNLVKPLYDRYQMIKVLLCSSPTISTIEEEDGSDEDSAADELPVPPPRRPTRPAAVEEDIPTSSLLDCLRETRAEKKTRRKVLKEFEDEFYRQTGRICQKEDRSPMKDEYQEYKQLKAKLRLLEVLLSKQDVSRTV
uniref:FAM13A-like domain-containing protein n=1 Tax=Stegastes partitus TaxID=144197 RepID=A0A3B5AXE3_9TELE